jgi:beta propeller domain-containing protein
MHRRRWRTGSWLLAIGITGCGGAATEADARTRSGALVAASVADAGAAPGVTGVTLGGAALQAPGSCAALLAALQADLFERTRQRAAQARESPSYFTVGANTGSVFEDPVPGGVSSDAPAVSPRPAPAPGTELPASDGALAEADILATQGDRLYLVDNLGEAQRLVVLESAPGEALRVLGSVAIEGTAIELMARGGRVLVFSRITGSPPGSDESFPDYEPIFTKLTVLDTSVAPPRLERELYVEGDYVFARQQGGLARVVIQHFPKLRLDAPILSDTDILGRTRPRAQIDAQVDAWVAITDDSVLSSGLDAYLPGVFERQPDGVLVPQAPSCATSFVPQPGRAAPGATSVFSLDLDVEGAAAGGADTGNVVSGMPLSSFTVFGYAQGVAVDSGAAIIRQSRAISVPSEAPRAESDLHVFELSGDHARYAASGSVDGYVSSIDRRSGVLRTITAAGVYVETEGGLRYQGNELRALMLGVEGERLVELGRVTITDANNSIGAARFVGSNAYLLATNVAGPGFGPSTTDLIALDLSDPRAPRETGRLPVAADSNVLVPMPGDRLLSLAHAPDPDGIFEHVEILLFDVADPRAPSLRARYAYGPSSSLDGDPHALAFSADLGRFGVTAYGTGIGSSLDVFELSAEGLTLAGSTLPPSPELTLTQCLELRGQPTDPEAIAAIEDDPVALAATLEQCNATRPRPLVRRAVLRADDAIVHSRSAYPLFQSSVASYPLDALDGPPSSSVVF